MTIKCEFCNGLGKDEDTNDCAWCWGTGSKAAQMRMTPPVEATTPDHVTTAQPAGQAQRHTIAHLRYAGGEEHNVKYVSEVDYDRVVAEREQLQRDLTARDEELDRLRAEQHQGEPVAWRYKTRVYVQALGYVWREVIETDAPNLNEVAARDLTPLYTHADPGVVERLRNQLRVMTRFRDEFEGKAWRLEAQLAERDALLREVVDSCALYFEDHQPTAHTIELHERCEAALSASAEPASESGWIDWHGGECPVLDDAEVEYSLLGNPGKVFSAVAARLDWQHDHRPSRKKPNICRYRIKQVIASAEPSAPVERDERAAFTAYLHEVIHEDRCDSGVIKIQRHETLSVDEERIALEAWQARAALERKQ